MSRQGILTLQGTAGNRAVAAMLAVQRNPVKTSPFKAEAEIDKLTLGGLDDYANEKPEWASDPTLPKTRKKSLVGLLEFARHGDPPPLAPCKGMPVVDLEAKLTPKARSTLRTYAAGVRSEQTVGLQKTDDVDDALQHGEAVQTLEASIPKATLNLVMGETAAGKGAFEKLFKAKEVDNFASYVKRARATLEANNGADVRGYLEMVQKDATNPGSYIGKLPRVRNYHRFQARLLNQLVTNESTGNPKPKKPLLLILHSGSDHNGAFKREAGLTDLVEHPRNFTIMIEGATSLAEAGTQADSIARKYGQRKKIQQLMIAGHGSPQSMDLVVGNAKKDAFNLATNRKRTENFLKKLLKNMDTGPDARIVLNACLTAADKVTPKLSKDPATARAEILTALKDSPSLAARLQELAGRDRTVEGNVSSVGAGEYMASDKSGKPTGVLHQVIPSDPYAASTDRANYVEHGAEPEGAMRAVVALWALDQVECLNRVNARRRLKITDWNDRVIHVLYDLVVAQPDNANLMNRIANHAAGGLGELDLVAEQRPGTVAGVHNKMDAAEQTAILGPLHPHAAIGAQIAMDQVWMHDVAKRQPEFLKELDTFATTSAAEPHLSLAWVEDAMAAMLPVAGAATPSSAQAKLALWALTGGREDPNAKAFLIANAGKARRLALPAGTTVDALTGGVASEDDVLATLGLRGAPAADTTDPSAPGKDEGPPPNFDLDGDGVNDIYIRSITRGARVTATWLKFRAAPSKKAKQIDSLPQNTRIEVFGEVGDWFAVEHGGKVGFVHKNYVIKFKVK